MADTARDAEIIASLQKPGAGVPLRQRLMMRYIVGPFVAGRADWDKDKTDFSAVNTKVLRAIDSLNDEQLGTRVLVPPQFGLEDSSRYWSAAMTLEHLVIVGKSIQKLVVALSAGIVPDYKADTAKVKPHTEVTPQEALALFKNFTSTVMADIDRDVKDRDSKAVFAHPWFGPFTARQWHWLLAVHTGLHLKQVRQTVSGLPART